MNDEQTPAELIEIERQLQGRPCLSRPALREKVLASIQDELRPARRISFWRFAASVAAVVAILINAGVGAARLTEIRGGVSPERAAVVYEQLVGLELDLPERELRRQCALLTAAESLQPAGRPYGSPRDVSEFLEE